MGAVFVAVLVNQVEVVTGQASGAVQVGSIIEDSNGDGISELATVNFTVDCAVDRYYGELLANLGNPPTRWEKSDLTSLLQNTHRNAVPRTDIIDETESTRRNILYEAIVDLDHASALDMVQTVYSARPMPSRPYIDIDAWTLEHLWPTERGASGEVLFSDVHNIRPERTRVTFMRGELFYGSCGTVEFADVCHVPADTSTAKDTATDAKIWLPPENVRGDIARALLYMDTRYTASPDDIESATAEDLEHDGDKLVNLDLVDCAPFAPNEMGYLSQLLQWHIDDPVNDAERNRNDMVCRKYQGNRNPFVDYPELVSKIFGAPQTINPATMTYPSCVNIPTMSPTPTRNSCDMVNPGDVVFYVIEMDDPDGVGFLVLKDIVGGVDLYITDNAWTGTNFLANEGVLRLRVPEQGYKAGERFGFGPKYGYNQTWQPYEGLFSLGIGGDTLILYCLLSDETPKPILAFSNNGLASEGGWMAPGLEPDAYGMEHSALPTNLVNASLAVPHFDNYYYDHLKEAKVDELRESMFNPDHWVGQDITKDGTSSAMTVMTTTTISSLLLFVASVTTTTVLGVITNTIMW